MKKQCTNRWESYTRNALETYFPVDLCKLTLEYIPLFKGQVVTKFQARASQIIALQNDMIAAHDGDLNVRVFYKGKLVRTLSNKGSVRYIAELSNGKLMCAQLRCVNIWEADGSMFAIPAIFTWRHDTMVPMTNGRLALIGLCRGVQIWNTDRREQVCTLKTNADVSRIIQTGECAVVLDADDITVWSLQNGQELLRLVHPNQNHANILTAVGERFVVTGLKHLLLSDPYMCLPGEIAAVAVFPQNIIAGEDSGRLTVWTLEGVFLREFQNDPQIIRLTAMFNFLAVTTKTSLTVWNIDKTESVFHERGYCRSTVLMESGKLAFISRNKIVVMS